MKSKWIAHQGKKVLLCDYSNFRADIQALQAEIAAVEAVICQQPLASVLVLVDLTNTVGTPEVVEMFKKMTSRTAPYNCKRAVVGVVGLKRMLAEAVARFSGSPMSYFDSFESARNWVVAD